jgi:hypothetical protein
MPRGPLIEAPRSPAISLDEAEVAEDPNQDGVSRSQTLQIAQPGHLRDSRAEEVPEEDTSRIPAGNEASHESPCQQRHGEPIAHGVSNTRHVT